MKSRVEKVTSDEKTPFIVGRALVSPFYTLFMSQQIF